MQNKYFLKLCLEPLISTLKSFYLALFNLSRTAYGLSNGSCTSYNILYISSMSPLFCLPTNVSNFKIPNLSPLSKYLRVVSYYVTHFCIFYL